MSRLLALGEVWDPQVVPTREDWQLLARTRRSPRTPVVDVLIPVYGSREHVLRCIYSVAASQQRAPFQIVVGDDASPDDELRGDLDFLAELGLIELYRNEKNLGFPGNCNRGFGLHPDRDVVLLNSDTLVYNDWLDRLLAHARRDDHIATVTPLATEGTICGYPKVMESNNDPLELPPAELDLIAARVNAGMAVAVPTGVGFCMFVSRRCLDVVGGFDVEAFGSGYGEENDLCLRASRSGLTNFIAGDIFVWHRGGVTFGDSKQDRIDAAVRKVEERHPGYLAAVSAFIQRDPVARLRRRLDAARIGRRTGGNATLMVMHRWGGGTERHVLELREMREAEGRPVVLAMSKENWDGGPFRIYDLEVDDTPSLDDVPARVSPQELSGLLALMGVEALHIHQLIGYASGADLFRCTAAEAGIPLDVTVHDYTPICPRIQLISDMGVYCGEPEIESCQDCIDTHGSQFGKPLVWEWRDTYHRLFECARTVLVPSHDVAVRMARYWPDIEFTVLPHSELTLRAAPPAHARPERREGDPWRVGVIGAIGPHKGSGIMLASATAAAYQGLPIEFVVIGYSDIDDDLLATGRVEILGKYEESDLGRLIAESHLDCLWFPAVWPETYSYTLTAAFETGLPIMAFDLGAIAERLRSSEARYALAPLDMMLGGGANATWLIDELSRIDQDLPV